MRIASSSLRALFARSLSDWRIRTLVPVVVIHGIVFSGFYFGAYRLALREVLTVYRSEADRILDALENSLQRKGRDTDGIRATIAHRTEARPGLSLHVFKPDGKIWASSGAPPRGTDVDGLLEALAARDEQMEWTTAERDRYAITAIRLLKEAKSGPGAIPGIWGAVLLDYDVSRPVEAIRKRLLLQLGLIVLVWGGLVMLMAWVRDLLIGRPVALIQKTIAALGAGQGESHPLDLGTLAQQLHASIWELLERQRQRETDLGAHLARAEQLAALGELTAALTHEIKNPLGGLSEALHLLKEEDAVRAPDRARLFDRMAHEVQRVTTTLDGLLQLSKPRRPSREETDIVRIAQNVADLFRPRLRRKRGSVEVAVLDGVPRLHVDPNQITQLLVNLLANSAQALGERGTITITVAPFPQGDGVLLTVVDNGTGIASGDADRVFEPFYTTKAEGTGLGLAICKQIVEQHGGTISLESEPARGTTVLVVLPARPPARTDGAHPDR